MANLCQLPLFIFSSEASTDPFPSAAPDPPTTSGFPPHEERALAERIQLGQWAERMMQRPGRIPTPMRRRMEALVADGRRALDWMVRGNERLAYALAQRFSPRPSCEDVRQAALEGLFLAALRFDPRRKVRFATYAAYWVRHTIQHAERLHRGGTIRLPTYVYERLPLIGACLEQGRALAAQQGGGDCYVLAAQALRRQVGPAPSGYAAGVIRRLTPERLRAIDRALRSRPESLDGADTDAGRPLRDRVGDPTALPDDLVWQRMQRRTVQEAVQRLPAPERQTIELMFYHEMDAVDVARVLRLTPEEVRAHYQAALERLRPALAPLVDDSSDNVG